jgi:hypothetical protein
MTMLPINDGTTVSGVWKVEVGHTELGMFMLDVRVGCSRWMFALDVRVGCSRWMFALDVRAEVHVHFKGMLLPNSNSVFLFIRIAFLDCSPSGFHLSRTQVSDCIVHNQFCKSNVSTYQ